MSLIKRMSRGLAQSHAGAAAASPATEGREVASAVPTVAARPPRQQPSSGDLVDLLNFMDTESDPPRLGSDYTHVSSLLRACPRQWALAQRFPEMLAPQSVQKGMRVIWALGRAAEHHARIQLIKAAPEKVYGDWSCNCGRHQVYGMTAAEAQDEPCCSVCTGGLTHYMEIDLVDEEFKVTGHPDLVIWEDNKFHLVEFKSCKKEDFEARRDGEEEEDTAHALQVLYYRRIMAKEWGDDQVSPTARIIYVNKDFAWGKSPYCQFLVSEAETAYAIGLDSMSAQAKRIKRAREGNYQLPDRLDACANPTTSTARGCPACTACFSM